MTPAMAMIARRIRITIAVAGRTGRSYVNGVPWPNASKTRRGPRKVTGASTYMKDGSPPWGGLGGYPFTPWERALGARGEPISPACSVVIGHGE